LLVSPKISKQDSLV